VLPPERIAEAILFALTRPPEASVETLDLRPRRK
jgi:NADP-dependent 3-hydroxy acid dehydrogenase YdfG